MKREIIVTSDGSTTIKLIDWDECYHSKHGAVQESKHVFIANGLSLFENKPIAVLEMGFGTGLNAFITFLEAEKNKQSIDYVGLEAYPISSDEVQDMNYATTLEAKDYEMVFLEMHTVSWGEKRQLSDHFALTKRQQFFQDIEDQECFDLIYFDVFGFRVQPELWSEEIFRKMYKSLKPNGVLVTYAARGVVKRNMLAVGFKVEKLPGPPGKREMFRAFK